MARSIILYGPARAPFTEKCRRALILKDLEFELREPSGPEDYARWSPETRLLPVMRIDGELVSDEEEIVFNGRMYSSSRDLPPEAQKLYRSLTRGLGGPGSGDPFDLSRIGREDATEDG